MNRNDVGYRIDETPDGLVVAVENSSGRSSETKLESAKLTNGVSDAPKMAPKPIAVATAKPAESVIPANAGPDAAADVAKTAPKPAVVATDVAKTAPKPIMIAAAKPADKPAPAAPPASPASVSKEPRLPSASRPWRRSRRHPLRLWHRRRSPPPARCSRRRARPPLRGSRSPDGGPGDHDSRSDAASAACRLDPGVRREADLPGLQGRRRGQPAPHPRPRRAAGTSWRVTTSRARSPSRCSNVTWEQALDTILEVTRPRRRSRATASSASSRPSSSPRSARRRRGSRRPSGRPRSRRAPRWPRPSSRSTELATRKLASGRGRRRGAGSRSAPRGDDPALLRRPGGGRQDPAGHPGHPAGGRAGARRTARAERSGRTRP